MTTYGDLQQQLDAANRELERLRAEVVELGKDKARLDWMQKSTSRAFYDGTRWIVWTYQRMGQSKTHFKIRQAIDAQMQ